MFLFQLFLHIFLFVFLLLLLFAAQIEDVHTKFANLVILEAKNWQEETKTVKKPVTKTTVKKPAPMKTKPKAGASSGLRAMIAAKRRAAEEQEKQETNEQETSQQETNGQETPQQEKEESTLAVPEINEEAKTEDGDDRTFDGGFFTGQIS